MPSPLRACNFCLCLLVSYIMWFHPLLIAAALLVLFQTYRVEADTASHKYKKDEHIELWVNKVRIRQTPKRHVVCVSKHTHTHTLFIHSFYIQCMYLFMIGRPVCQSARGVRVLQIALLRSRHDSPSVQGGRSVQRIEVALSRRTIERPRAAPLGTRRVLSATEGRNVHHLSAHANGGRPVCKRRSASLVLPNVLGRFARVGHGGRNVAV